MQRYALIIWATIRNRGDAYEQTATKQSLLCLIAVISLSFRSLRADDFFNVKRPISLLGRTLTEDILGLSDLFFRWCRYAVERITEA